MKSIGFILLSITISYNFTPDPRFHSYFEMSSEIDSLISLYPSIARQCTLGLSQTESSPILAVKISDNPNQHEDEPKILFTGIHHACELIGCEMCLYSINHLLVNYDTNALTKKIIDSTEIWIVPMVNPDGNQIVFSGIDSIWRKNMRDNNNNGVFEPNFDGVDLNRNYNFLFDSGGSSNSQSRTYRGLEPFSESETRAMAYLAKREKFVFDICYHSDMDYSQGERVYYPWRWGNSYSPDYNFIKPIAESIAAKTVNDSNNGSYTPVLGLVDGGMFRNYLYFALGTFAYTIETSRGYFPPGVRVDSICQRNLAGAYYLLNRVFGPSIIGRVVDSLTGNPLAARVRILEADASYPTILPRYSDSIFGRFRRIVNPGNYTVEVTKPGYGNQQMKVSVTERPVDIIVYLKPTAWTQIQSIPELPSNKRVGSGGSLVTVDDSLIVALKGNNTPDFYYYYVLGDIWFFLDSVPFAVERRKKVKEGASICYDQNKYLYLTKGNNTVEFWRYNIKLNQNEQIWTRLKNVPGEKRLKGGTGIAYATVGINSFIYLLKGSRTNEFFRFNTTADTWEILTNAPGEKGYKKGSALAYNQDTLIYCLKGGSKTNEFYVFDIKNNNWRKLANLPLKGIIGRNKRVRDGGSLIFNDGKCYALKGGNSEEFWIFNTPISPADTGIWLEREHLPILPSGKKVKAGGALAVANGNVFTLKGAKTNEFWVWVDLSEQLDKYGSQDNTTKFNSDPTILMNPYLKELKILGNITTEAQLLIYNNVGEKVFAINLKDPIPNSISLSTLSEGVYFLKLITNNRQIETKKIIIIK